jgi:serine/threonine-protein kinase RsbW
VLVSVEISLPRGARYVGMLRDITLCVLRDLNAPQEACDDIELALAEACANAVRHAVGTSDYSVRISVSEDGCDVEVADRGPGLPLGDPERRATGSSGGAPAAGGPTADDALDEGGRGLPLMRALVDDLQFIKQDQGTRVRLAKRWTDMDLALDRRARQRRR